MSSLNYQNVFSRFYTKVEAYDFLDLSETQITEFMCNYLHASVAYSPVRRLFSSISLDDEIQVITYTMKTSVDEYSDNEYLIEILALGIVVNWLMPKVESIRNIHQTYGTNELKYYSESAHLKEIQALLHETEKRLRRSVADRGYVWNTYLSGEE